MNNILECSIDGRKNVSEIIKTRLEELEEDTETSTRTLRIDKDEIRGSTKRMLEDYITNCDYEIIGSIEGYEKVRGNKTKGFYEFYVVKKEFAGVS